MILDHRTYTVRPGTLNDFISLYMKYGLPTQVKHLGHPYGWFVSDIGPQNQVVHMWLYESITDRDERRAAMQADPAWQAYLKRSAQAGYLVSMENKILKAAPFFTPRRPAAPLPGRATVKRASAKVRPPLYRPPVVPATGKVRTKKKPRR
jgi:hypothetical protein